MNDKNNKSPRLIAVTLGGVDYKIKQLTIRQARAWREQVSAPLTELVQVLQEAGTIELEDLTSIGRLLGLIVNVVAGSVDQITDFVFAYSPDILEPDKEIILNNAYDDEIQDAFIKILEVSYPFGKLLNLVYSGQNLAQKQPQVRAKNQR